MKMHKHSRDCSITNLLLSGEIKSNETISKNQFFDMIPNNNKAE